MKRSIAGLATLLAFAASAGAQTYKDAGGTIIPGVAPLIGCSAAGNCAGPLSATNPMPVTGTFSASLSGFAPGSAYATPLSVTTASSRVALPAGTVVVVYNTGTATAYTQLGGSGVTATTANDAIPAGGWMAFSVGTNGYLAAITASGTASLNISGGTGLPTGASGGGSGGGSIPTGTAGSPNAAVLSVQGVSGGTGVPVTGTFWQSTQPVSAASLPLPSGAATSALQSTINTTLGSPFQAGGSIGNTAFGISGTLPAFAATPTFNLGTLNGAATAANQNVTAAGTSASNAQAVQGVTGGVALSISGAVSQTLGTTNGWAPKLANALSTTVLAVKGSAGQLGMLQCYNPNSSQIYVQVFNVVSGSVTLGSTTPTLSLPIAPTATGGFALSNPGVNFSTAISAAATTTATGSTAPGTAPDCNMVYN